MRQKEIKIVLLALLCLCVQAVRADGVEHKMSSFVRQLSAGQTAHRQKAVSADGHNTVSVFVKMTSTDEQALTDNGCRILTRIGDIYIVEMPVSRLRPLAECDDVVRIETQYGAHHCLDTTAVHVNTPPAYKGESLPQAFTGEGVVVGISDIGFDLTHPTFYNAEGTQYRISRFLDQYTRTAEDFGHQVALGVEYVTEDEILQKQHSGDATSQMHGTHCLGIAAGSGFDTSFRGMAFEADLCAVASKTGDEVNYSPNEVAILKYIFDYADSLGKPCVITYSIGFDYVPGDAVLYEEALQQLLGPGHILVAAAGNENGSQKYFHKRRGVASAGGAVSGGWFSPGITFRIITNDAYQVTLEDIEGKKAVTIHSDDLPEEAVSLGDHELNVTREDSVYTFNIPLDPWNFSMGNVGIIVEGVDVDAHVLADYYTSMFNTNDSRLRDVEEGHNVMLPGTLDDVVTVGAINYRTSYKDINGQTQYTYGEGSYGEIASFSSVGPTIYNHIKPDVVAPGVNIISALNSFYNTSATIAARSTFNGRRYSCIAESGTSMATPAAAGVVALWLQAKPDLTPQDVLDVIAHTSKEPKPSLDYPNNTYGYGVIDAYRGLLYILDANHIDGLSDHQPQAARFRMEGHVLSAQCTATRSQQTERATLTVYTTSGREVATAKGLSIDLSSLPKGVYVVQLSTGSKETTGSTIIRL